MLPDTIKFRGATYVLAGKGPVIWLRSQPSTKQKNQRDPKPPGRRMPDLPGMRMDKYEGETAALHTNINQLRRDIEAQKEQYAKLFRDYNEAKDLEEATKVEPESATKNKTLRDLAQEIKALEFEINAVEKDIPVKQKAIEFLEYKIKAIEQAAALGPGTIKQVPIATREEPMFKTKPLAADLNAQKIEREQSLIAKLQAAKLKPEWADKPGDLDRIERMIADATKRLQDLTGQSVNPDMYGGAGSGTG